MAKEKIIFVQGFKGSICPSNKRHWKRFLKILNDENIVVDGRIIKLPVSLTSVINKGVKQ